MWKIITFVIVITSAFVSGIWWLAFYLRRRELEKYFYREDDMFSGGLYGDQIGVSKKVLAEIHAILGSR